MQTSSIVVDKARQLAAAGHHAEVVEYLGARKGTELADSPSVALLYGTAQARLGRHGEGLRWVDLALDQARKRDEQAVELHALNARGAIALVTGRIDEAADYLTRALMAASRDGDVATTGRCSNNLGRSEEHTSELQSRQYLVCRLLREKKKRRLQYNDLRRHLRHH